MKKKYTNLNEQISRMKSIFNDDRLYGNLNEKELVSEQRKIFDLLDKSLLTILKKSDNIVKYQKFVSTELNDVNDILKSIDEFENFWKKILPKTNLEDLKVKLNKIDKAYKNGKLGKVSEEDLLDQVLPAFPGKGGVRDVIYDMWVKAKREYGDIDGKNIDEPTNIDTSDVINDIGNEPVENLFGKSVKFTKENLNKFFTNLKEYLKKNPGMVELKVDNVDGNSEKFLNFVSDMKKQFPNITPDEGMKLFNELVKKEHPNVPETEIKKWMPTLKKLYAERPMKWLINPFQISEDTFTTMFKKGTSFTEKVSASGVYGTTFLFRVFVTIPVGWSLIESTYDEITGKDERSWFVQGSEDYGQYLNYILRKGKETVNTNDMVEGSKTFIRSLSGGKIDPDIIINNLLREGIKNIDKVGTNESFITCQDLKEKSNSDIIKLSLSKITLEEKYRINKELKVTDINQDTINQINDNVKKLIDTVINDDILLKEKSSELTKLIEKTRKKCDEQTQMDLKEKQLADSLAKKGLKIQDVTFSSPEEIQSGIEKEIKTSGEENSSGGQLKIDKEF